MSVFCVVLRRWCVRLRKQGVRQRRPIWQRRNLAGSRCTDLNIAKIDHYLANVTVVERTAMDSHFGFASQSKCEIRMPTIIMENRVHDLADAWLGDGELHVPAAAWARVSALPSDDDTPSNADQSVNVSALCKQLNRPLVHDKSAEVWSVGASAAERRANLESLNAPDFVLPDIHGTPRKLSEFRGQRVFLTTWSSW